MKLFKLRKAIIHIWNNEYLKLQCEKCGYVGKWIFVCWIKDKEEKTFQKYFLKYYCRECSKFVFKTPGYLQNLIEVLRNKYKDVKLNSGGLIIILNGLIFTSERI